MVAGTLELINPAYESSLLAERRRIKQQDFIERLSGEAIDGTYLPVHLFAHAEQAMNMTEVSETETKETT